MPGWGAEAVGRDTRGKWRSSGRSPGFGLPRPGRSCVVNTTARAGATNSSNERAGDDRGGDADVRCRQRPDSKPALPLDMPRFWLAFLAETHMGGANAAGIYSDAFFTRNSGGQKRA